MIADLPYTSLRDAILTHPTMAEGLNALFGNVPAKLSNEAQSRFKRRSPSRSAQMHRCELCKFLPSSAFLFKIDVLFCIDLQKSK